MTYNKCETIKIGPVQNVFIGNSKFLHAKLTRRTSKIMRKS